MKKLFVLLFVAAAFAACGDASAEATGEEKEGTENSEGTTGDADNGGDADNASQNMSAEDAAAAMNAMKESAEDSGVDMPEEMSDMMPEQ